MWLLSNKSLLNVPDLTKMASSTIGKSVNPVGWKHFHCKFSDISFSLGYYLQVKSPRRSIVDTPVRVYECYPASRKYVSSTGIAHPRVLSSRRLSETFPRGLGRMPRYLHIHTDCNSSAFQLNRPRVTFCQRRCFLWIQMFQWISLRTLTKPCKFLYAIPWSQFVLQKESRSASWCLLYLTVLCIMLTTSFIKWEILGENYLRNQMKFTRVFDIDVIFLWDFCQNLSQIISLRITVSESNQPPIFLQRWKKVNFVYWLNTTFCMEKPYPEPRPKLDKYYSDYTRNDQ